MNVYKITLHNIGFVYNVVANDILEAMGKIRHIMPEQGTIKDITFVLTLTDTSEV